jgi:hypothetical protein
VSVPGKGHKNVGDGKQCDRPHESVNSFPYAAAEFVFRRLVPN